VFHLSHIPGDVATCAERPWVSIHADVDRSKRQRSLICDNPARPKSRPVPALVVFLSIGTTLMKNQKVLRGSFLIAIALYFGIQASTYHIGHFEHAGPGLFPLMVSSIVGLIGLIMILESRVEVPEAMKFNYRNIAIILASLIGFVLLSKHLNMVVAIVYLVFFSTIAGTDYSVVRNLKICAALIAIAYAFHSLLGLSLPLI
jgi:hypothetical protein